VVTHLLERQAPPWSDHDLSLEEWEPLIAERPGGGSAQGEHSPRPAPPPPHAAVRAFRGDLRTIGTLELLKSLTAARASGIVSFETLPEGGVLLEDGLIVAASWGQLSGASALARLLVLTSGPFRVGAQLRQVQPDDPRAPQTLLLEAVHIVTRERMATPAPAHAAEPSQPSPGAPAESSAPAPAPVAKSDDSERAAALARLLARLTATGGADGAAPPARETAQDGGPSRNGAEAAPTRAKADDNDHPRAGAMPGGSAVASGERPPTISRIVRAEAAASRQSARPLRSKSLWWTEVVRGLPRTPDDDAAEEPEVAPQINPSHSPRSLAARIRNLLG
jgi:hypothetical protein